MRHFACLLKLGLRTNHLSSLLLLLVGMSVPQYVLSLGSVPVSGSQLLQKLLPGHLPLLVDYCHIDLTGNAFCICVFRGFIDPMTYTPPNLVIDVVVSR